MLEIDKMESKKTKRLRNYSSGLGRVLSTIRAGRAREEKRKYLGYQRTRHIWKY